MLLTGSYRRALDDKLRLAIPKPLRDQLPPDAPLYLTPGLDGCLAIYPQAAFAALADRLAASSPAAREVRDYSRLFFSQATTATPDSQWRLRVPAELIKWAKLSGEAMIVGVRDHLEVWAAERWDEYVAQCDGQYEQLAEAALMSPSAAMLRQSQETAAESSTAEEGRRTPR
jgi:MraZ protein